MSQSSATIVPRSHAGGPDDRTNDDATDADVLAVLTDADCRAILEALGTGTDRLTAGELSETCDVPLSTTYRKLERLTDAGLLGERLRIRRSGRHVTEYERRVDDVRIAIDAETGLDVRLSRPEPSRRADDGRPAGRW